MSAKITDTGVKFLGARKDKYTVSAKSDNAPIVKKARLSSIWKEPDWAMDAFETGKINHTLAFLSVYGNISKTVAVAKSADDERIISANEFYENAVSQLKDLYENHDLAQPTTALTFTNIETEFNKRIDGLSANAKLKYRLLLSKQVSSLFGVNRQETELLGLLPQIGFGQTYEIDVQSRFCFVEAHNTRTYAELYAIQKNGKFYYENDNVVSFERSETGKEQAIKKIKELYSASYFEKKALAEKDSFKRQLPLDGENRVGKDYLQGQSMTPKKLMDDLKFTGLEFGEWVTQDERKEFLVSTYNAFGDLMELIGLPLHYASLDGSLGVAFGSRGTSKASAHYDRLQSLIHCTKTKAIGNMAHEYGHALDNYLSILHICTTDYLSEMRNAQDSRLSRAMNEWVKFIEKSECKAWSSKLDAKRSKKYYATITELFARCFEQWAEIKLKSLNLNNNFLVYGTIPSELLENSIYPMGEEMQKSFELMNAIVQEVPYLLTGNP